MNHLVWDVHFFLNIITPTSTSKGYQVYYIFDDEEKARKFAGTYGIVNQRLWHTEYLKGPGVEDRR